jgi:hypothetical protein
MIRWSSSSTTQDLDAKLTRFWEISARKILALEEGFDLDQGAPVHTVGGRYRPRGWTEWTLGFVFGSALLQYDATDEQDFLQIGRQGALEHMGNYVTHRGVHDHGFNNLSTFGNLRRLLLEGRIPFNEWELHYYNLALRCSGAVQASRWTPLLREGGGFIYSFNGPHSLFADTMRSLRILGLAWKLGQTLLSENDEKISLLERLVQHARTTAQYNVYYGEGRDLYDVRGRVAHESLFNSLNGSYRCPGTQQGYSGRSTWTRGLAWIMLGFAELLEFLESLTAESLENRDEVRDWMLEAARATCDYYVEQSPANGIPYWDTGAPGLERIDDYLERPADPFNDFEPVDSSAASIAAQGLLRLGHYLRLRGTEKEAERYWHCGLTISAALFQDPYLSTEPDHQGLILHSVYHRPNGWDHIPSGRAIPSGEASMWGDYHARELALYLQRINKGEPYLTFWGM